MSYLLMQLAESFRLIGSAFVGYFGSVVLVAIALVPAVLRTFQLFTRNDNGWLELAVELLRVVLIAAMIIVGRDWAVSDVFVGSQWAAVGRDVGEAWRSGWLGIVLQLTVVTGVILLFNAVFESVVTTDHASSVLTALELDTSYAATAKDAVIFGIKNFVVIPVYLMAMLQAVAIVGRHAS